MGHPLPTARAPTAPAPLGLRGMRVQPAPGSARHSASLCSAAVCCELTFAQSIGTAHACMGVSRVLLSRGARALVGAPH